MVRRLYLNLVLELLDQIACKDKEDGDEENGEH
jgi:hypothetical protein